MGGRLSQMGQYSNPEVNNSGSLNLPQSPGVREEVGSKTRVSYLPTER